MSGGLDVTNTIEHSSNQSCHNAAISLSYLLYPPYSALTSLTYNSSTTGQPSKGIEYGRIYNASIFINDFQTLF